MKHTLFVLASLLMVMSFFLSACSQEFNLITTPTLTLTQKPSPTATPPLTLTPTPTSMPTPTLIADIDLRTAFYQNMMVLDIVSEKIISAIEMYKSGKLDQHQFNGHIQTAQHLVSLINLMVTYEPYRDAISQPADAILEACRKWWRGESDVDVLREEVTAARESIQPQLNTLRESLLAEGNVDMSFEESINTNFNEIFELVDRIMEYDSQSDIFQMQREHRMVMYGVAPTLGEYAVDEGYTAPDESFGCKFDFTGYDGELLYDFVFPAQTLAVFTDDFGVGQAVERRVIEGIPGNAEASRQMVENLFANLLLPALKQQHPKLKILQQKWVDTPRPMLEVIVQLPGGSFINEITSSSSEPLDTTRGLWIFTEENAVYTITYQDLSISMQQEKLTNEMIEAELAEILQSCTLK